MLICHLYIVIGEVSFKVFSPFIGLFVFLLLSFKNSLYILDNPPLSDVSFANIFYQSVVSLFILLIFFIYNIVCVSFMSVCSIYKVDCLLLKWK